MDSIKVAKLINIYQTNQIKKSNNNLETSAKKASFIELEVARLVADGNLKSGQDLQGGNLKLGNFNPISIQEIDWKIDPYSDRNWLWRYHQLEFVKDLLKNYTKSKNKEYLNEAYRWICSWLEHNMSTNPPSTLTWHDHATALRLKHFILFWSIAKRDGVIYDYSSLEKAIYSHCKLLCNEEFYSMNTNHGFDQMYILLLAANIFDMGDKSSEWTDISSKRLEDEINFSFPFGCIHCENSPSYHQIMLGKIIFIRNTFAAFDIKTNIDLTLLVNDGINFLAWIIRPDGTIPPIGDSTPDRISPIFSQLVEDDDFKHFQFFISKGLKGTPPSNDFICFEKDGWAIFRSNFSSGKDYSNSTHLVIKSTFKSNYHRHDDDTSLVLFAFGCEWFLDSGMYNYHEKDKKRIFVRSVSGHNLMVLNNIRINRKAALGMDSTKMWLDENKPTRKIHTSTEMFEGYLLQRSIEKLSENEFEIVDEYWPNGASRELNDVFVQFHVPMDKEITVEGSTVTISNNKGARIILAQEAPISNISIHSGIEDDKVQSWVSNSYGTGVDAQVIKFHLTPNGNTSKIKIQLIKEGIK